MKIRGFLAILLLVMVIVFILYTIKSGGEEQIKESVAAFDRAKDRLTRTNMKSLERAVTLYAADHGDMPVSLDEVARFSPLTTGRFDAWGTEIRYVRLSDLKFRLISAGADKAFDTEDDIVTEY